MKISGGMCYELVSYVCRLVKSDGGRAILSILNVG